MFWVIVIVFCLYLMISACRRGKTSLKVGSGPGVRPQLQLTRQPNTPRRVTMAWIPAGKSVQVAGRDLLAGLIYFGEGGMAANGYQLEPAQIDPTLPVDWSGGAPPMGYWSSYSVISPACRGTYLLWLASGRNDPAVDIGYVFLYYYGLERRAILDLGGAPGQPEVAAIAVELHRLLSVYESNHSFRTYASAMLDFILPFTPADLASSPPPADSSSGRNWPFEIPLQIRLWLGQCVAAGKGIPADWALAYLRAHPESGLRTAAARCASEFDTLFQLKYRSRFKDGIVVRPPKAVVEVNYRAASSGFMGQGKTRRFEKVPDVTKTSGLTNKLRDLGMECSDLLSAYSRYMGRTYRASDERVASLLPDELLATHGGAAIDRIRAWAVTVTDGGIAQTIAVNDLVSRWSPQRTGRLTRADAVSMASMFAKFGIGITPDVRFGDAPPVPGSSAVVFPLPTDAASAPSPHYAAASVLAYLCAVVASADGSVTDDERQQMSAQLKDTLGLDAGERRRFDALLSWLVIAKAGLGGIKKRIDGLEHARRATIGRFLVDVAAADGVITREEIATLSKLYRLLGLDESEVYSAIHSIGSADSGPVPVRMSEIIAARWHIPASTQEPGAPVRLDPAKVRARLAETATITAMLSDIFADDSATTLPPNRPKAEPISTPVGGRDGGLVHGLDTAHSQLARRLCLRQTWTRAEAEDQACGVGLPLLDGAIDQINEVAMDVCGEPFLEGDDPLNVNTFAVHEVL